MKGYIQTSDEEQLCKQFKSYIRKNKLRKYVKPLKYAVISVLLATAISAITCGIVTNEYEIAHAQIEANLDEKVYVTSNGTKFHLEDCRYLKNSIVTKMTVRQANFDGCQIVPNLPYGYITFVV